MKEKNTIATIREILQELGYIVEENPPDDILVECIEDSVSLIMFLSELEERFDIYFPDEMIDYSLLESVGLLMDTVNRLAGLA